ncbi:uncharacterized protein DS421_15g510080 [Arachis hypogaea]|nr:uncharacterized protein DS421_15g510080 [Arachis hypogaea]
MLDQIGGSKRYAIKSAPAVPAITIGSEEDIVSTVSRSYWLLTFNHLGCLLCSVHDCLKITENIQILWQFYEITIILMPFYVFFFVVFGSLVVIGAKIVSSFSKFKGLCCNLCGCLGLNKVTGQGIFWLKLRDLSKNLIQRLKKDCRCCWILTSLHSK